MNILVIGSGGQLGKDMVIHLKKNNFNVAEADFPAIDISNIDSTSNVIRQARPDAVINCAAFTAVDDCESKQEAAFAVNATGPHNIAKCCNDIGAKCIHISTDYVFDGQKRFPYIESDMTNPATVYGKSKLEGEKLIAEETDRYQIYRIAWLYGLYGNNFVRTILKNAPKKVTSKESFRVVNDQIGTPTSTVEVCRQIIAMLNKDESGIFHCTCEGICSWYDFTCEIVKAYKLGVPVLPCSTDEYPRPAPRPAYSVLENQHLKALNLNIMKDWKTAFYDFYATDK
ncbi:MAG TPA: dTDP-4-dehydrorhamnose reductase [Chitinispirillaceae bacterium]|nr:dTDP-4-dehydrorhamnose reductase [Chitinispirillaceae bacterium]